MRLFFKTLEMGLGTLERQLSFFAKKLYKIKTVCAALRAHTSPIAIGYWESGAKFEKTTGGGKITKLEAV